MIKINEIFYSIQGESSLSGIPTVFVRTSGCPLRCNYCDTTYAYHEGLWRDEESVVSEIKKLDARHVCITGGEPLTQKSIYSLMTKLCDLKFQVSLETSGAIICDHVDKRVRKVIDVKTPDSGENQSFKMKNLDFADKNTEFKFVICSEKDFLWAEDFCKKHLLHEKTNVLYSPSHDKTSPRWLAEKILSSHSKTRLQLQLHKYIWPHKERGV